MVDPQMANKDVLANVLLRETQRDIDDALKRGDVSTASRVMIERGDWLDENPRYDDGTYRPLS